MLLRYDFRNMLNYFVDSWLSVDWRFLMDTFEVLQEHLLDVVMIFHSLSLLICDMGDAVVHSSLNGGTMKELCVSFSFL